MSDRMDELDAITAVVQMYVDGAAKADVGRLKEAFHESARMFGNEDDESEDMPISEFFEEVATTPVPGLGFRSRIMSIDVVEDAAVAVLAEDDYLGVSGHAVRPCSCYSSDGSTVRGAMGRPVVEQAQGNPRGSCHVSASRIERRPRRSPHTLRARSG
jgi:hypothetical protein